MSQNASDEWPISKSSEPWVLLVEDDAIFSLLFTRYWNAEGGALSLVVAKSLLEMEKALARAAGPPSLMILDRNLPDGDGHALADGVNWPCHCWSAEDSEPDDDSEDGGCVKPRGKEALQRAVLGLQQKVSGNVRRLPPLEGSTRGGQE